MVAKDKKYFMPDQFSNPANPLAHYETTAVEILNDFPYDKIDVLVAGIGTGGTLMGIARRFREKYPDVRVIGVEPPIGDSIQGLKCLGEELPPFWDASLLTEKTTVTSQQAAEATGQLLEKEGIFAGLSSGSVVYQAVKVAAGMGGGNIVAVLADAGWKYLSVEPWSKAK
jgi:cysteine synthase